MDQFHPANKTARQIIDGDLDYFLDEIIHAVRNRYAQAQTKRTQAVKDKRASFNYTAGTQIFLAEPVDVQLIVLANKSKESIPYDDRFWNADPKKWDGKSVLFRDWCGRNKEQLIVDYPNKRGRNSNQTARIQIWEIAGCEDLKPLQLLQSQPVIIADEFEEEECDEDES